MGIGLTTFNATIDIPFKSSGSHAAIHETYATTKDSKLIFVNSLFTTRILELSPQESNEVLAFLYDHVTTPEFSCRFNWAPNSIAIWDNRSTQHKPINDYFPEHRMLHRVVIDGDKPY